MGSPAAWTGWDRSVPMPGEGGLHAAAEGCCLHGGFRGGPRQGFPPSCPGTDVRVWARGPPDLPARAPNPPLPPSCDCADAYDRSMAPMHTWVVRTGIKAGMIALPTREDFLESIGETEESARTHVEPFVRATDAVVTSIAKLYEDVEMPRSDFTFSWWS